MLRIRIRIAPLARKAGYGPASKWKGGSGSAPRKKFGSYKDSWNYRGPRMLKMKPLRVCSGRRFSSLIRRKDPGVHQSERWDPDPHQGEADWEHCQLIWPQCSVSHYLNLKDPGPLNAQKQYGFIQDFGTYKFFRTSAAEIPILVNPF